MSSFWHLFLFPGGEFIFVGQSLWSYLDCIQVLHFVLYLFSSCHICFTLLGYSCQGEYIFVSFLFQTAYRFMFMSSSLIYVFIVYCLKSRFYFIFACIFYTCGYAFYLSVSGNIQVDSIELLSTFATDGQQLGLNFFL